MLEKIFPEKSVAVILDHFIAHTLHDYNVTEVARFTGLNRITVAKHMEKLIEFGILRPARRIGRATQYELNMNSDVTKKLLELDFAFNKDLMLRAHPEVEEEYKPLAEVTAEG